MDDVKGKKGPSRKGLIRRLIDLAWRGSGRVWSYNRGWITGTPADRVVEDATSDEAPGLQGAELGEDERKQAAEDLRHRPRLN